MDEQTASDLRKELDARAAWLAEPLDWVYIASHRFAMRFGAGFMRARADGAARRFTFKPIDGLKKEVAIWAISGGRAGASEQQPYYLVSVCLYRDTPTARHLWGEEVGMLSRDQMNDEQMSVLLDRAGERLAELDGQFLHAHGTSSPLQPLATDVKAKNDDYSN